MNEQAKTENKEIELTYTFGAVTYVTTNEGVQAVFPGNMNHEQILKATINLYQAISKNQQDKIAFQNSNNMKSLMNNEQGKKIEPVAPSKKKEKVAKKKK